MDRQGTGNIDPDKIQKRDNLQPGPRRTKLYLALHHQSPGEYDDRGSRVSVAIGRWPASPAALRHRRDTRVRRSDHPVASRWFEVSDPRSETMEQPHMASEVINFAQKLSTFAEHWSPRVVAEMNDYQFKLVKLEGEFVWHDHKDTDEVFLVLKGEMEIAFRDRSVVIRAGEMFVVPKGVEHITRAAHECAALLVEPRGVINTGEAGGSLTAPNGVWG